MEGNPVFWLPPSPSPSLLLSLEALYLPVYTPLDSTYLCTHTHTHQEALALYSRALYLGIRLLLTHTDSLLSGSGPCCTRLSTPF
jgi:hypothetical protein